MFIKGNNDLNRKFDSYAAANGNCFFQMQQNVIKLLAVVSEKENFYVPMCILQIAAMLSVYRVLAHSNAHYFSCPPEAIDPRCTFVVIYSVGDLPRINTDMKVAYYKI